MIGNIIKSFKDPIIIKDDSTLENELQELKKIRNELVNKKQIDKDIANIEKGIKGEKDVIYELKNTNLGLYILRDIHLKYDDITAQIDLVVISKGYTYLIECKNLYGDLDIDEDGQFIRKNKYNDIKSMESPYYQAKRHKEILKKIWISTNSKLKVINEEKLFDNKWYKPLVVLTNNNAILNLKDAKEEVKNHTIRLDQLVDYIKEDIDNYDKFSVWTPKEMKNIVEVFKSYNSDDENNKFLDKYKRQLSLEKALEKELKNYRNEKSKKHDIPAYYIFTNDELDKIINYKPTDTYYLSKILSTEKIKYHGTEILEIIDKCRSQNDNNI